MAPREGYRADVELHDKDGRGHRARVLRHGNGDIYLEVDAKHNDHRVFSTLNLGPLWALLEKLAPLK